MELCVSLYRALFVGEREGHRRDASFVQFFGSPLLLILLPNALKNRIHSSYLYSLHMAVRTVDLLDAQNCTREEGLVDT